jgi:hypothetical protein
LFAFTAAAVPIKPDLQKILQQQKQDYKRFEPARAGWNGPEMLPTRQAASNAIYEAYGPASTKRAIRAALSAAATPDPAAIFAIGLLILMLRYTRHQRLERQRASVMAMPVPSRLEERRAA